MTDPAATTTKTCAIMAKVQTNYTVSGQPLQTNVNPVTTRLGEVGTWLSQTLTTTIHDFHVNSM